jgi:hypothetical protein
MFMPSPLSALIPGQCKSAVDWRSMVYSTGTIDAIGPYEMTTPIYAVITIGAWQVNNRFNVNQHY